ncbi:protein-ER retention protein [Coemansia sp. RSA 2559]|nr:protein-ER retention protein [Coemansia sp. RSA 2559]
MSSPVFLSDIIMADILTSCARMFSDIYLVVCHIGTAFYLQSETKSVGAASDVGLLASAVRTAQEKSMCRDAGAIGMLLVAAPYAFRLRQCLNEYLKSPPASSDAKRHIANAIKYASAFPMICLSATQRQISADRARGTYHYADWALSAAFGLWIASVAFNSLYSFYWDIAFDWDLVHTAAGWKLSDLVAPAQGSDSQNSLSDAPYESESESGTGTGANDKVHVLSPTDAQDHQVVLLPAVASSEKLRDFPTLLRPKLCFSSPKFYYAAMGVDFLLRIVWTLKLSSYVQVDMLAYGGFWLNAVEIYRRWQWTFLRIEKEAVAS